MRLAWIAVAIVAVGCSSAPKQANWEGEAAAHAVYATQIPLYPGAKVESIMGSDTYGDEPGSHGEGMAWWFEVTATQAELEAWYMQKLAGAEKQTEDDGSVTLTVTPDGAEPGERMGVILSENELRVFERTKGGKHRG